MARRTLKVYSTTTSKVDDVDFDGETWGELKEQLGLSDNVVATGRKTRATYDMNDAKISEDDIYLFVSPKKMSSGASLNEELNQLRAEVISAVNDAFDEVEKKVQEANPSCPECPDLEKEAKSMGLRA